MNEELAKSISKHTLRTDDVTLALIYIEQRVTKIWVTNITEDVEALLSIQNLLEIDDHRKVFLITEGHGPKC